MQLLDVNVLVYAFRKDLPQHRQLSSWLGEVVNGDAAFGVPDAVLSGFLRIVTHPRVFAVPTAMDEALDFVDRLRESPAFVPFQPGPRHWNIFAALCRNADVRGNLVPDAYLAAMAIEAGCEWITMDRDYCRFPALRWRSPLS
ncbi:MAG: type II toxin-antitoxin system VapC family toxin [Thermoguttaceae bacterium]